MTWGRAITIFFTVLVLSSCGGSPAMRLLKEHHNDVISQDDFGICKGYGCRSYVKTGLSQEEWQEIRHIFAKPAQNAREERRLIKRAIATFERRVGPKTGTEFDLAGAQIFNFAPQGQMDCIDEAFNSSTYLYLLRKAGLIRFHTLGKTLHRGNFINRWPHNTATIHQIDRPRIVNGAKIIGSEGHFVVDSWFHANGQPPEIVPAALWSKGWSPKNK